MTRPTQLIGVDDQSVANQVRNARGRFITFEGGEGAGKSTQIGHLQRSLVTRGVDVLTTREPGGTAFAEAARALLLTPGTAPTSQLAQALVFYAARADHLQQTIRPALERGQWVLCDRFSDSTRAYQGAAGGVSADVLAGIETAVVGVSKPDLTILLDLDPAIGLARANSRRVATSPNAFIVADTFESQEMAFHERLREGFRSIARAEPERIRMVDAFQNELLIADQIWRLVASRFGEVGS